MIRDISSHGSGTSRHLVMMPIFSTKGPAIYPLHRHEVKDVLKKTITGFDKDHYKFEAQEPGKTLVSNAHGDSILIAKKKNSHTQISLLDKKGAELVLEYPTWNHEIQTVQARKLFKKLIGKVEALKPKV